MKAEVVIRIDGTDVEVDHPKFGYLALLKPHVGRVFTKDFSDVDEVFGESFDQWAERVKDRWGIEVGSEFCPKWNRNPFKEKEESGPTLKATSLGDALKKAGFC